MDLRTLNQMTDVFAFAICQPKSWIKRAVLNWEEKLSNFLKKD